MVAVMAVEKPARSAASSSSTPPRSWMEAAVTTMTSGSPVLSTAMWRLRRPLIFLPASYPAGAGVHGVVALDRLGANDRGSGTAVASVANAHPVAQGVVGPLPRPSHTQRAKTA